MTLEQNKDKLRSAGPRSSALTPVDAVAPRTAGRDAAGRWVSGTDAPRDAAKRRASEEVLDALTTDEKGAVNKLTRRFVKELPASNASTRADCIVKARALVKGVRLELEAEKVGLATPDGQKLTALALKAYALALRAGVTARDLSGLVAAELLEAEGDALTRERQQFQRELAERLRRDAERAATTPTSTATTVETCGAENAVAGQPGAAASQSVGSSSIPLSLKEGAL